MSARKVGQLRPKIQNSRPAEVVAASIEDLIAYLDRLDAEKKEAR